MTDEDKIAAALDVIRTSGGVDGARHKQWTLDQVVRCLTGCPEVPVPHAGDAGMMYTLRLRLPTPAYEEWVRLHNHGDDGPDTYEWDTGVAP